jgi:hypothetical protein
VLPLLLLLSLLLVAAFEFEVELRGLFKFDIISAFTNKLLSTSALLGEDGECVVEIREMLGFEFTATSV